jgi:trimethylamine--corrinoid protein Co-methyltransferase
MRPRFELLAADLVERILDEAFQLLREPGIKVEEAEAIALLASRGASVDGDRVRIPESMVRRALDTAPGAFDLYDRTGRAAVRYGQGVVHFDPGSSGVAVLDPETLDTRRSQAADLARLIRVADSLPAYDAVSTAIVCHDVPTEIGDLYRLFVVLLHSSKPVVTGAFTPRGTDVMLDLLAIDAGGRAALADRPRAVFDVCPSPPLIWSEFACRNVMDLARAHVPAELISMPLAGVAAPVTLVGAIVQHAAESLAGVVLHQLAEPGAPIVWGGAPTIVDMRTGSTPMGAIETAMIDAGYAAVGQSLGLPTHAYLGATDSKVIDAQAGLETGMTALVGALAGIDMISGAGMLDFLLAQSAEKLVIDADVIGMAQRLLRGVGTPTATLATGFFEAAGPEGRFLELEDTRRLFRGEQFLPSRIIDRTSRRAWLDAGGLDAFGRARVRVEELVAAHRLPELEPSVTSALIARVREAGAPFGLDGLPGVPEGLAAGVA